MEREREGASEEQKEGVGVGNRQGKELEGEAGAAVYICLTGFERKTKSRRVARGGREAVAGEIGSK
jgi:hypothetical protein